MDNQEIFDILKNELLQSKLLCVTASDLSRDEKAITSDKAGTTTDQNTNVLEISGIRTIITDTAGLRKASRKVEKMGIRYAHMVGITEQIMCQGMRADFRKVGIPCTVHCRRAAV